MHCSIKCIYFWNNSDPFIFSSPPLLFRLPKSSIIQAIFSCFKPPSLRDWFVIYSMFKASFTFTKPTKVANFRLSSRINPIHFGSIQEINCCPDTPMATEILLQAFVASQPSCNGPFSVNFMPQDPNSTKANPSGLSQPNRPLKTSCRSSAQDPA